MSAPFLSDVQMLTVPKHHLAESSDDSDTEYDIEKPLRGVIKSFHDGNGFGFIECKASTRIFNRDVFLHRAQAEGLSNGQEVEFKLELNRRGMPQAREVRAISPPTEKRIQAVPSTPVASHRVVYNIPTHPYLAAMQFAVPVQEDADLCAMPGLDSDSDDDDMPPLEGSAPCGATRRLFDDAPSRPQRNTALRERAGLDLPYATVSTPSTPSLSSTPPKEPLTACSSPPSSLINDTKESMPISVMPPITPLGSSSVLSVPSGVVPSPTASFTSAVSAHPSPAASPQNSNIKGGRIPLMVPVPAYYYMYGGGQGVPNSCSTPCNQQLAYLGTPKATFTEPRREASY